MAIHCGRQNATIMRQCAIMRPYTVAEEEEKEDYAFCKVCDDSFSVAHCGGNVVSHASRSGLTSQGRTHRGIEQTVTMNSSVRQFFAAPSKTANSKAVSVTRADVMLCL